MSHTVEIELFINDLDALEEAAKIIGAELVRDQKTFHSYNNGTCEHAIRLPGNKQAYEVGVVARRDGKPGYTLMTDFFVGGYGMEDVIGKGGKKLEQAYTVAKACKHYRRKGYAVRTETKADNRIIVKCRKG